jgi:N-acetylhexosamine 1-kinase
LKKKKFLVPNCVLSDYFNVDNILDVIPYGNGHINKTYLVIFPTCKYIIQKLNNNVFENPFAVTHNIELVTSHIKRKVIYDGKDERSCVLSNIQTKYGQTMAIINNDYWRCVRFIEEGITYEQTSDPKIFEEAGVAVGQFQRHVDSLNSKLLVDTIKHFHDTPYRYNHFLDVVKIDRVSRVKDCSKEIEFINNHKDYLNIIVKLLREKKIPRRVTHNDTKLNNIMIDKKTKKALGLIDLDTVMNGSLLYDFGDALRLGASLAKEDETDLSKVGINFKMFRAFSKGYLKELKGIIKDEEIKHLLDGYFLMCFEVGLRFLTDYIDGDNYFVLNSTQKQTRPNINLKRARNQLKLSEEVLINKKKLTDILNEVLRELKYHIVLEF